MDMQQQTQIPEALLGVMMLGQAAQSGQFQPTTPDGTPTVAAQLMERAAPMMGMNQAASQAGLAGQIEAMRMQKAQEALMNNAMQRQQAGGLEAMNPPVGNFAYGGIVGYNGMEDSFVEEPAQAGGAAPIEDNEDTTVEEQFAKGLEALQRAKARQITGQQVIQRAQEMETPRTQFLQSQGVNPKFLEEELARVQSRTSEQEKYYRDLAAAKRAQQEDDARRQFFLGARGARFGEAMRTGAEAVMRGEKATEAAVEKMTEMRFDIQNTAAKEQRLLRQAQFDIANGRFDAAQKELFEAEKLRQQREQKEADFRRQYGMELGREGRFEQADETRRRGQDLRLQAIRERLERAQNTGTAKGARVHKTITGPDGGVIAIMSDGSQVPLGVTSADFNRSIARIISEMEKNVTGFSKRTEEEKRRIALERLTGGTPASAPPPVAAPKGTRENPIKLD